MAKQSLVIKPHIPVWAEPNCTVIRVFEDHVVSGFARGIRTNVEYRDKKGAVKTATKWVEWVSKDVYREHMGNQMRRYETWRDELVTIAISECGYGLSYANEMINLGHYYQVYYNLGMTPAEAMRQGDRDGV